MVASLDIDALYPSLDVKKCTEVIVNKLYESDVIFEGLQWMDIVLYLRYRMNDAEWEMKEYKDYCPTRKNKKGPKPKLTGSGTSNNREVRMKAWIFKKEKPDDRVVRKMFCDALGIMIKKTMEMHDYKYDKRIFRQVKGGAIGMDLTGVIADIYMCEWDKKMIESMVERGYKCEMYKRYKDDINIVFRKRDGMNLTTVEIMNEIKGIADGVDGNLKVKTDTTENHNDGKLPILDLKVWIGYDRNDEKKLLYTHYMKDVSTKKVIQVNSAHGEKMKQNVLVNDICRVMRNCSERLEWDNGKKDNLEMYMRRMQFSGYSEEERYEILKKAYNKYEKRKGEKRINGLKMNRNESWYLKDKKSETVMYVNATPNERLKKKIEQLAKKRRIKVKVVERRGNTVKKLIQKSDPFSKVKCGENDCIICQGGMDVDCRKRGVVYEIECMEDGCRKKYVGQTGRSLYERIKEHNIYNERDRENENKPIARHSYEEHQGRRIKFGVKVIGNMYGRPTKRIIGEAVYIDDLMVSESMNEKRGWSHMIV